jgi:acetoin utilization deacetylase AcuC-like enzyme
LFRIRRVYDRVRAVNQDAIAQVQAIMRTQFPGAPEDDVVNLPQRLEDPIKHRFRYILLVGEDLAGRVQGFALVAHASDLRFCFLDYISAVNGLTGRGIGGALYQHVREEALALDAVGVFMECLPDDEALCPDREELKVNRARLRFYERFGARPVMGTAYETPFDPEDVCAPYLVIDALGRKKALAREAVRAVVRAILERKYGRRCPAGYVEMVVGSFRDDPVRLRGPRYARTKSEDELMVSGAKLGAIALVVNDRHQIHHVRERGYVEAPIRVETILKGLEPLGLFEQMAPRLFSENLIRAVHDGRFVSYLKRMCALLEPGKSLYPYVFPIRNASRPPREMPVRAGYYCIDTFTPLNANAFRAARRAVDCAVSAAQTLMGGFRLAYALVRPPGHHAERRAFGGFCYFNSAAVAANYLSGFGRVAVVDVDYHHGNGTQDIFYERDDVLTASIHGHPSFAYPYFSGFKNEIGLGAGQGFNLNLPLGERLDGPTHARALERVLRQVRRFDPQFLVIALGFDTARGDATGTWSLRAKDFEVNGRLIGAMKLPTLIVQEGGYRIRSLAANARHFFRGLAAGAYGA